MIGDSNMRESLFEKIDHDERKRKEDLQKQKERLFKFLNEEKVKSSSRVRVMCQALKVWRAPMYCWAAAINTVILINRKRRGDDFGMTSDLKNLIKDSVDGKIKSSKEFNHKKRDIKRKHGYMTQRLFDHNETIMDRLEIVTEQSTSRIIGAAIINNGNPMWTLIGSYSTPKYAARRKSILSDIGNNKQIISRWKTEYRASGDERAAKNVYLARVNIKYAIEALKLHTEYQYKLTSVEEGRGPILKEYKTEINKMHYHYTKEVDEILIKYAREKD
jgi:hypothetical protein